jgi:hypothetical protein
VNVSKAIVALGGRSVRTASWAAARRLHPRLPGRGRASSIGSCGGRETRTTSRSWTLSSGPIRTSTRRPPIGMEELALLEEALFGGGERRPLRVFGSTGNGVDASIYARGYAGAERWFSGAVGRGRRGPAAGAAAKPTALKPNIDELSRLVAAPPDIAAVNAAARVALAGGRNSWRFRSEPTAPSSRVRALPCGPTAYRSRP